MITFACFEHFSCHAFIKDNVTPLQVWFGNVPHTRLVEDKGGQNWIIRVKNKFKFPGGGTQFIHGANEYLDHMSKVITYSWLLLFSLSSGRLDKWIK